MKPKAEHILNMPGFFESMHSIIQVHCISIQDATPLVRADINPWSISQGMQKEKMRQRTKVHKAGDLSALHEDVGTEVENFRVASSDLCHRFSQWNMEGVMAP